MNPQDPTRAQLKEWARQDAEAEKAKEWEAIEQAQKEELIDLQALIEEDRAEEAVYHALEMADTPIIEDGRRSNHVFLTVQWLKNDAFFKAELDKKSVWWIELGVLHGHIGEFKFFLNPKYSRIDRQLTGYYMVLVIGKHWFAFDGNDEKTSFTQTLQALIKAQEAFEEIR